MSERWKALGRWLPGQKKPVGGWLPNGLADPELRSELSAATVEPGEVAALTRQLATLLSGGVPLVQALGILRQQPENPLLGDVVGDVGAQVGSGHRLSAALSHYPKVFGQLFVTMVAVGENCGLLDQSLRNLADWLEKDDALRRKVKAAMTYPLLVFGLAVLLTVVMFVTVLPGFITIFEDLQTPLPLITQLVVLITKALRHPLFWLTTVALGAGLRAALRKAQADSQRNLQLYRWLQRIPGLGGLLFHSSCARYCATVGVLLNAGMDLRRSLTLAAAASGSPVLEQDAKKLVNAVIHGHAVGDYMMAHPHIYSGTMTQMAVAGEEASRLPEMLTRASRFHELEVESRIEAISAALEPILLSGVAVVVGTVLVAFFIPLYGIVATLA